METIETLSNFEAKVQSNRREEGDPGFRV